MQLNEIDAIRLRAAQTAFDAFQNRIVRPIFAPDPTRMPAFGKKEELVPPLANRFANRFLAALIAFRRIDDVNAGIERAVQYLSNFFKALACDGGSAKTEHGYVHIRSAKAALFHRCHPKHDPGGCHAERKCQSSLEGRPRCVSSS